MIFNKLKKGYTLIEILLVIAISVIILAIILSSFNSLIKTQALDKDYSSVASLIDQAKSLALNSKAGSQYGVHFASSTVVLFKGTNFSSGAADNQTYFLNSRVSLSADNLIGSTTAEILFSRITGYANASGTVALSLKADPNIFKIIRIYHTGTIAYK